MPHTGGRHELQKGEFSGDTPIPARKEAGLRGRLSSSLESKWKGQEKDRPCKGGRQSHEGPTVLGDPSEPLGPIQYGALASRLKERKNNSFG